MKNRRSTCAAAFGGRQHRSTQDPTGSEDHCDCALPKFVRTGGEELGNLMETPSGRAAARKPRTQGDEFRGFVAR